MTPSDFIHPEDAAALQQLEIIPGFAAERKLQSSTSSLSISISDKGILFCTHCGARMDERARFCSRCGERRICINNKHNKPLTT